MLVIIKIPKRTYVCLLMKCIGCIEVRNYCFYLNERFCNEMSIVTGHCHCSLRRLEL